ncbi:MAG: FKBP-type peptidyl-prolyl cis-trans isomerase [Candidatus Syntropharchaeia archaeon]
MAQAKIGDTVKVHYTGKLEDGTVFDTSIDREPLQFTIGERQIIPGFEEAVVGMSPGESKTTKIPSDKAYGPHHRELVVVVNRSQFPENFEPVVGEQLEIRQPGGHPILVMVTEVSESTVTLDANHPLAGKDLTFEIELVEIL